MTDDKGKERQYPSKGRVIEIIAIVASVLISICSLTLNLHPELKYRNSNHIEMANAGVIKSQLFLAQSYFEIGDYDQSIYWYKILAMGEIENKGPIYYNLAYLYMVYSQQENPLVNYKDIALDLFLKAGASGAPVAYRNAYIVLLSNPIDSFENYNPSECIDKKRELEELINHTGVYDHDLLCMYDAEWKHPTTFQTFEPVDETERENEKTVLVATGKSFGMTIYTYKHYVRKISRMGDYKYIDINNMNADNERGK